MTKRCSGCGIVLQNDKPRKLGYIPDLNKDLCMRCFKLKHYNVLTDEGLSVDNNLLIDKINKKKCKVIFLVDFLNIDSEVIGVFKKLKGDKILVLTKSDLIPRNVKKDKLVENIKNIYDIKEDIYYCSSKTKENINLLVGICKNAKNVLMAGFTNAGKSSIINVLVDSDITVSRLANTTQDFIKLSIEGITIFDAPGFMSKSFFNEGIPKNQVIPITYQLVNKYYLKLEEISLYVMGDTNVTIYMKNMKIEKRKVIDVVDHDIVIPRNSDLVIKGLGFIKFSKETRVNLNIDKSFYEVRPSIIGGNNE